MATTTTAPIPAGGRSWCAPLYVPFKTKKSHPLLCADSPPAAFFFPRHSTPLNRALYPTPLLCPFLYSPYRSPTSSLLFARVGGDDDTGPAAGVNSPNIAPPPAPTRRGTMGARSLMRERAVVIRIPRSVFFGFRGWHLAEVAGAMGGRRPLRQRQRGGSKRRRRTAAAAAAPSASPGRSSRRASTADTLSLGSRCKINEGLVFLPPSKMREPAVGRQGRGRLHWGRHGVVPVTDQKGRLFVTRRPFGARASLKFS